jgi:hypothetical protein
MNDEKNEKKKQFAIDFLKSLTLQHFFRKPCADGVSDSSKILTSRKRG